MKIISDCNGLKLTAPQPKNLKSRWIGKAKSRRPKSRRISRLPRLIRAAAFDWNRKITAGEKFETVNLAPFFNDRVTQIFRNEYRSPRSPFASLATPKQGIGGWCEPNANFDVDDSGLRAAAAKNGGEIILPDGIALATPSESGVKNIAFTSQWDNYPREVSVPLAGKSSHAFLLMAGSTGAMQAALRQRRGRRDLHRRLDGAAGVAQSDDVVAD